jgi:hypothetical protein
MKTMKANLMHGHSPPLCIFIRNIKPTSMKPTFLLFLLLVTSFFTAHSQLDQGTWLAGGTGKFYSYTSDYSSAAYSNTAKYTQIDLSPNIGYFIIDKLAFGLKPTFSSIKGKVTTIGGLSTNVQRYWIGPFARYYFLDAEKSNQYCCGCKLSVWFFRRYSQRQTKRVFCYGRAGCLFQFGSRPGVSSRVLL